VTTAGRPPETHDEAPRHGAAGFAPLDVTRDDRALVRAMIDLNAWDALRDQDVGHTEAVTVIAEMLIARITTDSARA
jgi:hypothetical protein